MTALAPSTKVTRQTQMAVEDIATMKAILEATPFCNVAFVENLPAFRAPTSQAMLASQCLEPLAVPSA